MPRQAKSSAPARGYSWAPFERGNEVRSTHGAYVERHVDPVARQLVSTVLDQVGYLASDPSYEPALWAWARAEARVLALAEWLDEHGPLDEHGQPRRGGCS